MELSERNVPADHFRHAAFQFRTTRRAKQREKPQVPQA
jgi:hypothetical protein